VSKERWSFKLSDVKRAIQVAKDMRLPVSGYRILPDGSIEVITTPPKTKAPVQDGRPNSFDQVLGQCWRSCGSRTSTRSRTRRAASATISGTVGSAGRYPDNPARAASRACSISWICAAIAARAGWLITAPPMPYDQASD